MTNVERKFGDVPPMEGAAARAHPASGANEAATLKEQIDVLREDVRALGRMTKEAAREEIAAARERGAEYLETARGRLGDAEEQLVRHIREHPVRSMLIAAGTGALLSMIARR